MPGLSFLPRLSGMIEHAQLRREARRFLPPVEDERFRHDDERGRDVWSGRWRGLPFSGFRRLAAGRRFSRGAQSTACFEYREHLRGFADAHVVSQTTAEAKALQKIHPARALFLIAAQLADEFFRLLRGLNAVESFQLFTGAREGFIKSSFRL